MRTYVELISQPRSQGIWHYWSSSPSLLSTEDSLLLPSSLPSWISAAGAGSFLFLGPFATEIRRFASLISVSAGPKNFLISSMKSWDTETIYIYIRSQVVQVLKCKDELLHTQDREFHQHPHPTVQCPAAHPHVPSGCEGVSDDTSTPPPQASWVDCLSHLWSLERQINGEYVTLLGVQYTSSWQVTNSLEFLMPYLSSASKTSGRSLIAFFNLGGGNVTGITMSITTSDLTTNISTIRTYRSKKLRFHFFQLIDSELFLCFFFLPFFRSNPTCFRVNQRSPFQRLQSLAKLFSQHGFHLRISHTAPNTQAGVSPLAMNHLFRNLVQHLVHTGLLARRCLWMRRPSLSCKARRGKWNFGWTPWRSILLSNWGGFYRSIYSIYIYFPLPSHMLFIWYSSWYIKLYANKNYDWGSRSYP